MNVPTLDDPRHNRLLQWELTAPASRDPKTKNALAAELGISDRTLRDWAERPEFMAAWKLGFQAVAGSAERTKTILDQLYEDWFIETNVSCMRDAVPVLAQFDVPDVMPNVWLPAMPFVVAAKTWMMPGESPNTREPIPQPAAP